MSRCGLCLLVCVTAGLANVGRPSSAASVDAPARAASRLVSGDASSRELDPTVVTSVEAALARLRTDPGAELRDYRARRRLHAVNHRLKAEAWMEVMTEVTPLGAFRYEIVSERGSGYVRSKVLRTILEREQSMWREGEVARAALTDDNYTFAPAAVDTSANDDASQSDAWLVSITPRRRDTLLIIGHLIIDAATGDLRRIEGRFAKSPSFWTSRVEVVRRYGPVNGVRVPLSTESVAHVKVAGRSEFDMTYEYQRINGGAVDAPPVAVAP